jgi:hypothetical protein
VSDLDYCTEHTVYAVQSDPGEEGDIVDLDEVIEAGIEALGLGGRFALAQADLVDCGRGLW